MKPGDRVHTTAGPGVVIRTVHDTAWAFRQPQRLTWIIVQLDSRGFPQVFAPHEIHEEEPMPDTDPDTTTVVDPTQPAPTPEPPEPEPEPTEPEPNEDEQPDSKSTRRVVITEDEVELVEWP